MCIDGCDRPNRSATSDVCNAHYFRLRRTGQTGPAEIRTGRLSCSVDECPRRYDSDGYCTTHLRRVRKGGSPDYVAPVRTGAANTAWKGQAVGYTAAHDRVRRHRGPATRQACACGSPARHWAYNHQDPNELVGTRGIPYSGDPRYYVARCVPCHKRADLARLRSLPSAAPVNDAQG